MIARSIVSIGGHPPSARCDLRACGAINATNCDQSTTRFILQRRLLCGSPRARAQSRRGSGSCALLCPVVSHITSWVGAGFADLPTFELFLLDMSNRVLVKVAPVIFTLSRLCLPAKGISIRSHHQSAEDRQEEHHQDSFARQFVWCGRVSLNTGLRASRELTSRQIRCEATA